MLSNTKTAKAFYDTIRQIIFVVDVDPPDSLDFVFALLNQEYEERVGLKHADITGKKPFECLEPQTAAIVVGHYADCVQARREITYFEYLRLAGEENWWKTHLNPLFDEQNRIWRLIGTSLRIEGIESKLRAAINNRELEVLYQRICELSTDSIDDPHHEKWIAGYEALLRWGNVPPLQFLPIAKESGLMPAINQLVIDQVTQKIPSLPGKWVSINVSDFTFHDYLKQRVTEQKIDNFRLWLEITEDATIDGVAEIVLSQLNGDGHPIELDDFGTQKSNMDWLRLPADGLKIDKAFVRNVARDKHKQSICQAIASVAERVGLTIVAEGVETKEDALWLLFACNISLAQGWYFGKPEKLNHDWAL